ncbi:hypothetical protein KPA97_67735, partial [Burkholderia cenocepacia]|nr:hypothetical protein [Burkholderia cenocepacia]
PGNEWVRYDSRQPWSTPLLSWWWSAACRCFTHPQAALVDAADVDRYFIQAKTCNYFSQD